MLIFNGYIMLLKPFEFTINEEGSKDFRLDYKAVHGLMPTLNL